MNCLDCNLAGVAAAAIGICRDCGAGVCATHATVRDHHLTRTVTINRLIPVEPPARVVRCHVCTAAHDAAACDTQPHHRAHFGQRLHAEVGATDGA